MRCCQLVCSARRQNGPSAEKCEKDKVAATCVLLTMWEIISNTEKTNNKTFI